MPSSHFNILLVFHSYISFTFSVPLSQTVKNGGNFVVQVKIKQYQLLGIYQSFYKGDVNADRNGNRRSARQQSQREAYG